MPSAMALFGDAALSRNLFNMSDRQVMHAHPQTDLAGRIGIESHGLIKASYPLYNQFSHPDESRESVKSFCKLSSEYDDVSLLIGGEQFGSRENQVSAKDQFLK
jgi:hypothetical protein